VAVYDVAAIELCIDSHRKIEPAHGIRRDLRIRDGRDVIATASREDEDSLLQGCEPTRRLPYPVIHCGTFPQSTAMCDPSQMNAKIK